jgi:hypothetical protein
VGNRDLRIAVDPVHQLLEKIHSRASPGDFRDWMPRPRKARRQGPRLKSRRRATF